MQTAEQRVKMAAELLDTLADAGLTMAEMTAVTGFVADQLEKYAADGGDPIELLTADRDKQASLLSFAAGLPVMEVGGSVLNKALSLGETVAGKAIDTGMKYAPLTIGAGLALPVLAGYGLGHGTGTLTDNGDEMVRAIHQRELVSMLRENARLADQQRAVEEQRQQQIAARRRPRRITV